MLTTASRPCADHSTEGGRRGRTSSRERASRLSMMFHVEHGIGSTSSLSCHTRLKRATTSDEQGISTAHQGRSGLATARTPQARNLVRLPWKPSQEVAVVGAHGGSAPFTTAKTPTRAGNTSAGEPFGRTGTTFGPSPAVANVVLLRARVTARLGSELPFPSWGYRPRRPYGTAARHGTARHGTARHGTARHGHTVRPDGVRHQSSRSSRLVDSLLHELTGLSRGAAPHRPSPRSHSAEQPGMGDDPLTRDARRVPGISPKLRDAAPQSQPATDRGPACAHAAHIAPPTRRPRPAPRRTLLELSLSPGEARWRHTPMRPPEHLRRSRCRH